MRILFIGALWKGSTGRQRMVALRDLGHEVVEIDSSQHSQLSFVKRVLRRLGYPLDIADINSCLASFCEKKKFELIWVDKTLSIFPHTLQMIKEMSPTTQLLFYSPDDMMLPANQTRTYLKCLPWYDLHVTTKSYNVAELKKLGARAVFFVDKAYDPHTHRPIVLTRKDKLKWQADVGFVGGFEQERYEMMYQLAQSGLSVIVRGPGWENFVGRHSNLNIESGWVFGDDYARTISATKINLCFLRKVARDLQTARSIEIPACGGFMIAERTHEHCRLFQEGREAEYFSNIEELIKKANYYLTHDNERERIARAGRERCIKSGYSNQARLTTILEHLENISTEHV